MKQFTARDALALTNNFQNLLKNGFKEALSVTNEWLNKESTKDFFFEKEGRLSEFYETSGIRTQWNRIIHNRASMGADLTEEIYHFARNIGREKDLTGYTMQERLTLNKLCDNSYELIRGVTEDQISGIRRQLITDYTEGINPYSTTLKEHLQEVQLQPINGWSPEKRAEIIARTETRRTMNTATLETYKEQGVEYVSRMASNDPCDECEAKEGELIPISEALDDPILHPNCNCGWKPERNPETGLFTRI